MTERIAKLLRDNKPKGPWCEGCLSRHEPDTCPDCGAIGCSRTERCNCDNPNGGQ